MKWNENEKVLEICVTVKEVWMEEIEFIGTEECEWRELNNVR